MQKAKNRKKVTNCLQKPGLLSFNQYVLQFLPHFASHHLYKSVFRMPLSPSEKKLEPSIHLAGFFRNPFSLFTFTFCWSFTWEFDSHKLLERGHTLRRRSSPKIGQILIQTLFTVVECLLQNHSKNFKSDSNLHFQQKSRKIKNEFNFNFNLVKRTVQDLDFECSQFS